MSERLKNKVITGGGNGWRKTETGLVVPEDSGQVGTGGGIVKEKEGPSFVLEAINLSIFYGRFCAVRDVSMQIEQNKITALIGPSGCGKSTLLRAFNRMNELVGATTEGRVLFRGQEIYDQKIDSVEVRRRIGMVFQKANPFPKSIFDNVAYGPRILGVRSKRVLEEIVEQSLHQAVLWEEVKDNLKKSALALSGGQQQRMCIARALAVEPEVLLMDEPCSALDPVATLKIENLMRELGKRYTIVIVTHNMQQAQRVSDYTAMMLADEARAGRMIEFGPTGQVFSQPKDDRVRAYVQGEFG